MNLPDYPLINGQAYDWASVTINMFGMPIKGITEINYKVKQDKKNNYAAGVEPSSRGRAKKEYEADITLEEVEVRRILAALPANQSLVDIAPFPIVVSYMVGTKTVIDKIMNCEFMEEGVATKEGDTTLVRKLPLIIAGITWGR